MSGSVETASVYEASWPNCRFLSPEKYGDIRVLSFEVGEQGPSFVGGHAGCSASSWLPRFVVGVE